MSGIVSIEELSLAGHKLLVRLDLNVPMREGRITSDARIRAALPTLRHALDQEATLVICSHFGRPKGKPDAALTLEPVAGRLSELLGVDVTLADDCVGDGVRHLFRNLGGGDVLLLENLRFHPGETANDPEVVRRLVEPFDLENDIYINDAFGASHRAHASIVGAAMRFAKRGAGFLLQAELRALSRLLGEPARPFVAIVGGAKVSDKLGILSSLLGRVNTLCIGGAMAYTFLRAAGKEIGTSRCEEPQLAAARDILERATRRGVEVLLPTDHVVGDAFAADTPAQIITEAAIPANKMGLDIGPASRRAIAKRVAGAETIFWNGPMGVFEWPAFAAGSLAVAKAVGEAHAYTVVGGGDSVALVELAGVADEIDHVSTGGGASLELLQYETLPGLEALAGTYHE